VISAYKDLAGVERDFRSMKVIDVDLRPVHHRLEDRVRSHAFICMLSTYLSFHLRRSLAPLTFTDTEPPTRDTGRPASASKAARKKAAAKKNAEGEDVRGFRELLEHLGLLPATACVSPPHRDRVRSRRDADADSATVFELLGVPSQSTSCSQNYLVAGVNSQVVARACFRESKFGLVSLASTRTLP